MLHTVGKKENVRGGILLYVGSLFFIANSFPVEAILTPTKQRTLKMCKVK